MLSKIKDLKKKSTQGKINTRLPWHHQLDHIVDNKITRLEMNEILNALGFETYPTYESCL